MLDEIMVRLCELLEHERKMRSEVMTALRYPIMVIIAFAVAIIVMTAFVLPRFIDMIAKLGANMPLPTRIPASSATNDRAIAGVPYAMTPKTVAVRTSSRPPSSAADCRLRGIA